MGVQADYRAAAVSMLNECSAAASVQMQVYRARPASLYPPTGFVDNMADNTTDFSGSATIYQHAPLVTLYLVWGKFDSGEAVDQRDAFVDAFHDWVRARPHEAGARSLIGPRTVEDDPNFVPDWLPEQQQGPYYATRIVLEGFVTD